MSSIEQNTLTKIYLGGFIFLLLIGFVGYNFYKENDKLEVVELPEVKDNVYVNKVIKMIDSMKSQPDTIWTKDIYSEIEYTINDFYLKNLLEDSLKTNKEYKEILSTSLKYVYHSQFVDRSIYYFGENRWNVDTISFIRRERANLDKLNLSSISLGEESKLRKIDTMLVLYQDIRQLMDSCANYKMNSYSLEESFPASTEIFTIPEEYIENEYMAIYSWFQSQLDTMPYLIANKHLAYLFNKLDFHTETFFKYENTSDYEDELVDPLMEQLGAFTADFSDYDYQVPVDSFKNILKADRKLAYAHFRNEKRVEENRKQKSSYSDNNTYATNKNTEVVEKKERAPLNNERKSYNRNNAYSIDCYDELEKMKSSDYFTYVPQGKFKMGSKKGEKNEQPVHKVSLNPFLIAKTEVTTGLYLIFCKETGHRFPPKPFWGYICKRPIVNISWDDAMAFCKWASKVLNRNVTLPTEAQWEYAAMGGAKSNDFLFSGGSKVNDVACYGLSSIYRVKSKNKNELGLYDMSGNAWEWCLDSYSTKYYSKSPNSNPVNLTKGSTKVIRGGSWSDGKIFCRVRGRSSMASNEIKNSVGMRIVSPTY